MTHKVNTENGYENGFPFPASDCLCLEMALFSGERVGVVVNKDYCFDINEIQLSKKIHEAKKIQTRISNERKWFERTRICRIPLNLSRRLPGLNFKACH